MSGRSIDLLLPRAWRWVLIRHPGLLDIAGKRLATARARAALKGIVLTTTEADDGRIVHIASQGAWLREFCAIDELEAWLDQV